MIKAVVYTRKRTALSMLLPLILVSALAASAKAMTIEQSVEFMHGCIGGFAPDPNVKIEMAVSHCVCALVKYNEWSASPGGSRDEEVIKICSDKYPIGTDKERMSSGTTRDSAQVEREPSGKVSPGTTSHRPGRADGYTAGACIERNREALVRDAPGAFDGDDAMRTTWIEHFCECNAGIDVEVNPAGSAGMKQEVLRCQLQAFEFVDQQTEAKGASGKARWASDPSERGSGRREDKASSWGSFADFRDLCRRTWTYPGDIIRLEKCLDDVNRSEHYAKELFGASGIPAFE